MIIYLIVCFPVIQCSKMDEIFIYGFDRFDFEEKEAMKLVAVYTMCCKGLLLTHMGSFATSVLKMVFSGGIVAIYQRSELELLYTGS